VYCDLSLFRIIQVDFFRVIFFPIVKVVHNLRILFRVFKYISCPTGPLRICFASDEPIRSSVETYYWRLIKGPARICINVKYAKFLVSMILRSWCSITWRPDSRKSKTFNSIIMIGFVQNEWNLLLLLLEQYWHNEFGRQHSDIHFHLRKLSSIIERYFQRCSFIFFLSHKKMIIFILFYLEL